MGFELKSDPDVNIDELVRTAGEKGFFYDDSGPNDYGEILRLYQIGKQLNDEYEMQYNNTFVREKEIRSNLKHAIIYLSIYVGMFVLDELVKFAFGLIPGTTNTAKGFLALLHYILLLGIVVGAVLVAVPFTVNLLKQYYLYKMLTDPTPKLNDDRAKYKVITLADERRFLQGKLAEYQRLYGAMEKLDKRCKGIFYSYENKKQADELMASFDRKTIADMHRFSNVEEFRAKSIAGKESISAWWIFIGALIPLVIAIFSIANGLKETHIPGFM